MIIIGYQGVGKSTLAGNNQRYIDLESGSFWYNNPETQNITRDPYWYKCYCNVALHLDSQGYDVFVSSHEVVRKELLRLQCDICAVVPSVDLKDAWIDKLHRRYQESNLDKDYKAWKNAEDRFESNIQEIIDDIPNTIQLQTLDYNLWFAIVQARANSAIIARKSKNTVEPLIESGLDPTTGEWGHNA